MQYFTKDELQKLPKWAKEIITSMELHIRDLEEYQQTKENEAVETPYYGEVTEHSPFNTIKHYLPKYSTLVAHLKKSDFKVRIKVDHVRENFVSVDIGDGLIVPQARNVIHIYPSYNKVKRENLLLLSTL